MKLTKEYLKRLIQEELKHSEDENTDFNHVSRDEITVNLNDSLLSENFESVEDQNIIKESEYKIQELKSINEEIKRMKQLVDFRRPLLHDRDL